MLAENPLRYLFRASRKPEQGETEIGLFRSYPLAARALCSPKGNDVGSRGRNPRWQGHRIHPTGPEGAERGEVTAFNPLRVEGGFAGIAFRGFASRKRGTTQVEPLRGLLRAVSKPEQDETQIGPFRRGLLPAMSKPEQIESEIGTFRRNPLAAYLALGSNPTEIVRCRGHFKRATRYAPAGTFAWEIFASGHCPISLSKAGQTRLSKSRRYKRTGCGNESGTRTITGGGGAQVPPEIQS